MNLKKLFTKERRKARDIINTKESFLVIGHNKESGTASRYCTPAELRMYFIEIAKIVALEKNDDRIGFERTKKRVKELLDASKLL
jgi:hypothetical protein